MHALLKSTCEIPLPIDRTMNLAKQVNPVLSNDVRRRLRYMHKQSFDQQQGGLLSPIKFIDRDSTEYSLVTASEGAQDEERMARLTLDNAMSLIDPVWGGVYQYSTQGAWDVPHYRKTMAAQAGHLRLYSLAYAQLKYSRYKDTANAIKFYIKNFMSSEFGAFYSGQADSVSGFDTRLYFSLNNKDRETIGIPKIDKRIITRENGWVIEALAAHYEFCDHQDSLNIATNATKWINENCRHSNGAYVAHSMAENPIYLADTLAMARALLQLYRVTFDKQYLKQACQSAGFIYRYFKNESCGYNSKVLTKNESTLPRQIDENISLSRFANLLDYYSGDQQFTKMAKHGLRYLCIPEVATARMEEAGVLLIDREISTTPLSISIHGKKHDPRVDAFMRAAYNHPGWYKLIKFNAADSTSAVIKIDGIKSKPVTSLEKFKSLLLNY